MVTLILLLVDSSHILSCTILLIKALDQGEQFVDLTLIQVLGRMLLIHGTLFESQNLNLKIDYNSL